MEEYKIKYGENIYDYNYEDLIENPNNVIPGIINWLDWDWDEKYLSPHQNKRNVYTASSAQIRKKFYSSSIGIWKEYKELLEPAIEIIKTNKILRDKIFIKQSVFLIIASSNFVYWWLLILSK